MPHRFVQGFAGLAVICALASCASQGAFVHPINTFEQYERDTLQCEDVGLAAHDRVADAPAGMNDSEAAAINRQDAAFSSCMGRKGYAIVTYTPGEWAELKALERSNAPEAEKTARLRAWHKTFYDRKAAALK